MCLSISNPPQIPGGARSILQSVLIGVPLQPHPACLLHSSPEISLNHIQFFSYEMTFGQANMLDRIKRQSQEHQHLCDASPAQKDIRSPQVSDGSPERVQKVLVFFPTLILSIPRSELRKRDVGAYFKLHLAF